MISGLAAVIATGLATGCVGPPDLDAANDPLVVTETAPPGTRVDSRPDRAAAVAEMRAKAEAGETMPFPDAFQAAQTARLAARPEPKPINDVAAIEAELAGLAERQRAAIDAGEIAGLKTREAELRRLLAEARAEDIRP